MVLQNYLFSQQDDIEVKDQWEEFWDKEANPSKDDLDID